MGSTFSIYNDTKNDIMVWQSDNIDAIIWPITGVLTVASLGAAGAAFIAAGATSAAASSAAVAAAFAGTPALITTASGAFMGTVAPATVAGLTAGSWTIVGLATQAGFAGLTTLKGVLEVTDAQAEAIKNDIVKFRQGCDQVIKPGETFIYKGTLSLTRMVYLMNENGEQVQRACWTGATDGADIRYKVNKDWEWKSKSVFVLKKE